MSGRHFDLCGPLPAPGITVLEASAGTGKTFTVAGLITRFVAEGIAKLPEILAVTFTRSATGELKDRVRSRLVSAERAIRRLVETGEAPPAGDELLSLLANPALYDVRTRATAGAEAQGAAGTSVLDALTATKVAGAGAGAADELCRRWRRLSEALATFDSATIATTHGFCYMVLGALGVWGEFSPGAVLLEDPRELVQEVVDDLYARWVAKWGTLPFSPKEATEIGRAAVGNLGTDIEPPPDDADATASGLRRRLAKGVTTEVARRLIDANLLTYDGMLVRLKDALTDPERGESARRRLGARYRVVLVDEFQDTDLVQWEVVRRAFSSGDVRLVLVGDPKQAIYGFRGADVYAYLAAARTAGTANRATLDRNWRSDACLAAACDALFYPLQLGHPDIAYRPAGASCQYEGPRILGAPVPEPLRVRWLDRSEAPPGLQSSATQPVRKGQAVRLVAEDLAADVAKFLASAVELVDSAGARPLDRYGERPGIGDSSRATRPLGPGDIAVLVRTNDQATTVQTALVDAGVPAVVSSARSVMSTPAARDWLVLLDALQQPASRSLAAGVALGDFFGRRARDLASGDERVWEEVHARLHDWSLVLRRNGVAALFAEACAGEELPKRLLSEAQGERRLTDLAHVAELLHAEARRSQLGPAALRAWLARRIDEAASESNEDEELCRRLDSDSKAVQILTVHRAKGLEFPVVYCPYLWDPGKRARFGSPISFHEADGSRKLDVGEARDPSYRAHFELVQDESQGEDLRQMYVAMSRAKQQLVLWWAPATNSQRSPLGRVLLGKRSSDGALGRPRSTEPRDHEVAAALDRLVARAPGLVSVEKLSAHARKIWEAPVSVAGQLWAMPFDRALDTAWGRLSYSSVTAGAYGAGAADDQLGSGQQLVASEPEEAGTGDEPELAATAGLPTRVGARRPSDLDGARETSWETANNLENDLRSVSSPWSAVPAGTAVGTFVHSVLQLADFSAPQLSSALSSAVHTCIGTYPGDPADSGILVAGLEAAITTPLGALAGGASLRDIKRADRLDELGFELPLAGGDKPSGRLATADLGQIFSRYIATDEPLGYYADTLRSQSLETVLRGYLTGSLDLVFRLPAQNGAGQRYFVVDYKTNWLAPAGEMLSAWHYRPVALEAEMRHANYVLQALFYVVALHRYLRWRLPGYQPEAHLGGVLYLFVRGMTGPSGPVVAGEPCGVFSWAPPAALVRHLSDLLARGAGGGRHVAPREGEGRGGRPGSGPEGIPGPDSRPRTPLRGGRL